VACGGDTGAGVIAGEDGAVGLDCGGDAGAGAVAGEADEEENELGLVAGGSSAWTCETNKAEWIV
jgi:hypothetical protein